MTILKIIGVLLFLLTGSEISAATPIEYKSIPLIQDIETEANFSSHDKEKVAQSTFSGFVHNLNEKISIAENINFYFYSLHTTRLTKIYINLSRHIDPSLDISDIIFPFHFFS